LTVRKDLRGTRQVSARRIAALRKAAGLLAAALAFALPSAAQYPGQIAKPETGTPQMRSVAVLEWTGDALHPKASRLVPVSVYDGQQLQDGGIYLCRPQPVALDKEVEYQLEQDGKLVGLFEVDGASQQQEGSWLGFGAIKPLPSAPTPEELARQQTKIDLDDENSDKPILHRKHPAGDSGGGSGSPATPPDSDRPTLHRSGDSAGTNAPAPDSGRPRLQKKPEQPPAEPASTNIDLNRPRLKHGIPTASVVNVVSTLMGLPADMRQEIAVSDAQNTPEHPWSFTWANPGDEAKMKTAMEEIARKALGLAPPPSPPARKTSASARRKTPPPSPPAQLLDEQFRVFELAYGSVATMVLSARTDGFEADRKFVTLVAQPDLYGNVAVLLKNVTDAAHLDVTPRMRLIDPVDALRDNRGELLFELRGATQRQFALYRIFRGQATQLFVTGGAYFGAAAQSN
jgi:hypothetical protein